MTVQLSLDAVAGVEAWLEGGQLTGAVIGKERKKNEGEGGKVIYFAFRS